jgi:putative hydrolase of the HAD superfamily
VVISDRVGLRKPDSAIYRLAADKLGVPSHGCVFADDNPSYLPPAAELGMAVVHFADVADGVAQIEDLLGLS